MLSNADVAKFMADNYVVCELYVDDRTPLAEPMTVVQNGRSVTLRTVGDANAHQQITTYGSIAQPLYVISDPASDAVLAGPYGYEPSVSAFMDFLRKPFE